MQGRLDDKIALITGGSSGMGLATAERFLAEGATVYITGRRQELLDEAQTRLGPRLRAIRSDASDENDIAKVFATIKEEVDRLDVLFAAAGTDAPNTLADITLQNFHDVFALNVRGTLFAAQQAAELMTEGGSIILNGSAAAEKAIPASSLYSASKAALKAFARVWSAELAPRGIRVNVLHPGPIDTPFLSSPEFRDKIVPMTTIGRLGRPQEIASAALFLATPDSGYVVGTELFVTGGMGQS